MKSAAALVSGIVLLAWAAIYFLSGASPSVNALSDASSLRDASEPARVELAAPAPEDPGGEGVRARRLTQPGQEAEPLAPGAASTLTVRIGPRPDGTETFVGQLMRPRRASAEDDAPEWYLQERVLAVSLTGRGGGSARLSPFDGEDKHAMEPLTLQWEDVPPDTYDVTVELRGDAGSGRTQLTGIVVGEGDTAQDPRLAVWDPMVDFDVMRLFIEVPLDREAKRFVIGTSEGDRGRAVVCQRRLLSREDDLEVHGPFYVVHDHGHPALVHAFDELGGEVIVPLRPHDRRMSLPDRVLAGVAARESPDGLDADRDHDLTLERVSPPGEWCMPIPTVWIVTSHLPSAGHVIPISVPARGLYRWAADDGDWSSDPFEIESQGKRSTVVVELTHAP